MTMDTILWLIVFAFIVCVGGMTYAFVKLYLYVRIVREYESIIRGNLPKDIEDTFTKKETPTQQHSRLRLFAKLNGKSEKKNTFSRL